MVRYRITYDNGYDETITAADVHYDTGEGQYRLVDDHGRAAAFIPGGNVLSIVAVGWSSDEKAVTG
ncbi:hypothetical protein ABT099_26120 [Streptomyces prasinus]|uniref:hypothetical protein n=1 Tax=Streptomyces prasinus TaxID=67345 RepID=UPI00332FA509